MKSIFVLVCTMATAWPGDPAPPPVKLTPSDAALEKLAWMAGSWAGEIRTMVTEEHWTQPSGGTMLGVNRQVVQRRTMLFEYLRIESRADGIYYVANPGGKGETAFKMVKLEGQSVVFENRTHKAPHRIIYRREGHKLHARVETDLHDGSVSEHAWMWTRAVIVVD